MSNILYISIILLTVASVWAVDKKSPKTELTKEELAELNRKQPSDPNQHYHRGMCDASAAVRIDEHHFLVANDEDNYLRLYRSDKSGSPVQAFNMDRYLKPKRYDDTGLSREVDIEGAARIKDRIYWISSHGRNKDGKKRSSRLRFFATDLSRDVRKELVVQGVGKPNNDFVKILTSPSSEVQRRYKLNSKKKIPPKKGGINIEGLCATPEGTLLIGFRSPLVGPLTARGGQHALIVPLRNPADILEKGAKPDFGHPIEIALEGLGIRSIAYWPARKRYMILAGPVGSGGPFRLFQWKGPGSDEAPKVVQGLNFGVGSGPEGLIVSPKGNDLLVLLDEGTKIIAGMDCKTLPDPKHRRFTSVWLRDVKLDPADKSK